MSHTVTMKVQIKNKTALGHGVAEMKGIVLGDGSHKLYQGYESGYGFTLPSWSFPLVLKTNGELAYDDYHGIWGNPADVANLMERYAVHAAKIAAEAQGWMTELVGGGLIIHHPSGGTLTVGNGGVIDAQNFMGSSCTAASETIEAALGNRREQSLKSEFFAERARITLQE